MEQNLERFMSSLRYETIACIEGYSLKVVGPNDHKIGLTPDILIHTSNLPQYKNYRNVLNFSAVLSKYLVMKHYPNPKWKSLMKLPPRAYYNTIELTEDDLMWRIRLGPYSFREELNPDGLLEKLRGGLKEHNLSVREGALEQLLTPIVDELAMEYPLLTIKKRTEQ